MKARESFFFGMIPVLFPILSDRCRNSVVFFNYCFTDTHLSAGGDVCRSRCGGYSPATSSWSTRWMPRAERAAAAAAPSCTRKIM